MDLRFKTNLLEHTKAVGEWARVRGAQVSIDALDLSLTARVGTQSRRLWPQFVGRRDGQRLVYFDLPDRHAIGFVGWLPHRALAWDVSLSKLAFKALAQRLQLFTPAWWTEARNIDAACLIKRDRGAFGEGMRGPFDARTGAAKVLAAGEFAEAFVQGRIARAWYWCGRLTVLELFEMPAVQGDGRTPLAELLRRRGAEDLQPLEALARLQGLSLTDAPAAGRRVLADYRYVSPLNPTLYANSNQLSRLQRSAVVQHLQHAGERLWPHVSTLAAQPVGFVLDAIVDDADSPWLLEINSNAQGHPDHYAAMLDGLFQPVRQRVEAHR